MFLDGIPAIPATLLVHSSFDFAVIALMGLKFLSCDDICAGLRGMCLILGLQRSSARL